MSSEGFARARPKRCSRTRVVPRFCRLKQNSHPVQAGVEIPSNWSTRATRFGPHRRRPSGCSEGGWYALKPRQGACRPLEGVRSSRDQCLRISHRPPWSNSSWAMKTVARRRDDAADPSLSRNQTHLAHCCERGWRIFHFR